jgi:hypothetical protein
LSFMRWTHLPSAYTPFWIVLSLPAYLLGLGYFLFTLWSVKALAVVGYLTTTYFVAQILKKKDPKFQALGVAILGLNPLVIFESLVSGHNDIVMMAFAMMSIYALVMGKKVFSFFYMAMATATKLMTVVLLPAMIFGYKPFLFLASMLVALAAVVSQREILPWYFVWIMPFVALLPRNRAISALAGAFSFGLLLRYAPYFYLGFWDPPVPVIKMWVTAVPPMVALAYIALKRSWKS